MQAMRICLVATLMLINSIVLSGCWNYREIDTLAIVAGVAIDKGIHDNYELTAELIQVGGGRDPKITSKLVTMQGKTILDAVRNGISVSGKKLYWSHIKVVIVSKDIVDERLIGVIDWFNRDAETRADVNILVSRGQTAKEILEGQALIEPIKSIELANMIQNQSSLVKAPQSDLWKFANELQGEGISAIASAIELEGTDDHKLLKIAGSAIFKKDKMAGYLTEEETKALLFVKNQVEGGVLVLGESKDKKNPLISLEIFKNSTKIKSLASDQHIEVLINTNTVVGIDEIHGATDVIHEEGLRKLEHTAEVRLKKQIEDIVEKSQKQLKTDILGLGAKIHEDKPDIWRQVADNWEEEYPQVKVIVQPKVHIKNTAMISKTIKVGD